MADQPNPPRQIPSAPALPHITALSTAFPLRFESPEPPRNGDASRGPTANNDPARRPHRHDAGE